MGVAKVLRASVKFTVITVDFYTDITCVAPFFNVNPSQRQIETFSPGNSIEMSSFLWRFSASEGSLPYTAGGLAALFREACGRVVSCECCGGVTVGCFCRATTVVYDVAVARSRLAAVVARGDWVERDGGSVVAEVVMAIEVLVAAEEEMDWWWDENEEARRFLDELSPSERGRAWHWRLQREWMVSMLSEERRVEQQLEDAGASEDDA